MIELDELLAGFRDRTIAVAFHDLETGEEILINPDESFAPASTIKVAVMMEIFNQVRQGELHLDEQIPVANSFKSIGDGSLFSVDPDEDADGSLYERLGGTASVQEITRLMIVRSSNLGTNILVERIGGAAIMSLLNALGIEGVQVLRGVEDYKAHELGLDNRATARGLMLMMKSLAEGEVVSLESSMEMIEILLGQEFNEGIPAGLPEGTRVAHKTGWVDLIYHDFGIVLPRDRRPYVLAVMTRGFENVKDAHTCVAEVSRRIHEGLRSETGAPD